jgi:hypothetical protein
MNNFYFTNYNLSLFRKPIPRKVLLEIQQETMGSSCVLQLFSATRWFDGWRLIDMVKRSKEALKKAIWSPLITTNTSLNEAVQPIKALLLSTPEFWPVLDAVEAILAPLAKAILAIEGSEIDLQTAYRLINQAFVNALAAARRSSDDEIYQEFETVCYFSTISLIRPAFRSSTTDMNFARAISRISLTFLIRSCEDEV